jgi:AcrR family transcriptional regulator
MPKVSDEHKDAVRRRIMDAALTCLERNGFQDVTTRELLGEAGLSTGTFYNYFPSKEHLYEALAEELLSADIAEVIDDSRPLGDSLLVFVRDFLLTQRDGAIPIARFRSQASNSASGADAVARLNRWMLDQFVPIVQTAQADGIIDADAVSAILRDENTSGGTELFPHLYEPLPVDAVVAVTDIDDAATFRLDPT